MNIEMKREPKSIKKFWEFVKLYNKKTGDLLFIALAAVLFFGILMFEVVAYVCGVIIILILASGIFKTSMFFYKKFVETASEMKERDEY